MFEHYNVQVISLFVLIIYFRDYKLTVKFHSGLTLLSLQDLSPEMTFALFLSFSEKKKCLSRPKTFTALWTTHLWKSTDVNVPKMLVNVSSSASENCISSRKAKNYSNQTASRGLQIPIIISHLHPVRLYQSLMTLLSILLDARLGWGK